MRKYLIWSDVIKILKKFFSSFLPDHYLIPINEEYIKLQKAYHTYDVINLGIAAGHLCELISSLICVLELNDKQIIHKIHFDSNYKKMMDAPKPTSESEVLLNIVPNVLKGIYSIRNKKKIAHFKLAIPQKIDNKTIKYNIDWVIAQLLIIYCNIKDPSAMNFLESFAEMDFPLIEKFDNGEILFLTKNLSEPEKIIYIIGIKYGQKRVTKEYIIIKNPELKNNLTRNIGRLKSRLFLHESSEGLTLTKLGLIKLSDLFKKLKKIATK